MAVFLSVNLLVILMLFVCITFQGDPSTLPLVAWQFVIIQVTSSERIIDPVIAFARDKHIHFFQVCVCVGSRTRFFK